MNPLEEQRAVARRIGSIIDANEKRAKVYAKELHQKERLRSVLERLVNTYNARGEFIACITPPHRCDAKKGDKVWTLWNEAVKLLDS